ncbi:PepSY-associated TM helix domain-containing protein [Aquimarina hainanensis]|uniref:PepSY-associated TM helix domain-containing protein n=1 Tax=Aquimarina hainanensis TaxID=1578017 RepID=A0ABW5NB18_9FLAO
MKKSYKKGDAKRLIRFIHEWMGLTSGLIVFIVSFSGTLFVFADEFVSLCAGDAKYVTVDPSKEKLPVATLIDKFKEQQPRRGIFYVDTYTDSDRSFRIASEKNMKDFTYTYMDPYSGEILKNSRSYWFFFFIAARIHAQILMYKVGQTIVGIATIIFLLELISGLILWFPKRWNKKARKASFTIKQNTNWKRRVYDLHKILGFYALLPALLITVTGLIMAYKVLTGITQNSFGGTADGEALIEAHLPKPDPTRKMLSIDEVISKTQLSNPETKQIRIGFPHEAIDPYYLTVVGETIGLKSWIKGDFFFTNRYTGDRVVLPASLDNYTKINQTVFDLHVGHWWGLFGKIITFIIGIICSSLPVTGFILWLRKKKKEREKRRTKKVRIA